MFEEDDFVNRKQDGYCKSVFKDGTVVEAEAKNGIKDGLEANYLPKGTI